MNLTLRRVEPADYEAMQKLFNGSKVVWGTLQLPFPSIEMWRKRLAEPPEGVFGLVACVDNEIVGQVSIHTNPSRPRRRHTAGLGMAVRDDFQGQGVGTALMRAAVDVADNWLNILRLELEVYTDNEAAIRLYKKFDFEIEGTHRRHSFRAGQYVDVYAMARFKPG